MKKIKLIIFLLLLVMKTQAQTAIPAGVFTVNGKIFEATIDTYLYPHGGRVSPNTMHIRLVGGDLTNQAAINIAAAAGQTASRECIMSVFDYSIEWQKTDFVRFFNIMRSVFSANRLTDIMNYDNEGIQGIYFYITPSGVVKDMTITISENTLITPQEIELLYTRMLTQMSFSTSPVGCSGDVRFFKGASVRTQRELYTDPYYYGSGPVWADR